MATLPILHFPDPRLRTPSLPVAAGDDEIRTLLDDMLETMYEAPGIGLAAPQVNVFQRVIEIDISEARNAPHYFVNPEIVERRGTHEFARGALAALLRSEHQVLAVYTQPDRPAGRGRRLTASPVKQLAEAEGIPVQQPASLKPARHQQTLRDYRPDVMVVVAYGLILPQAVLDIPRLGCLNIHGSLLPRWRGSN